MLAAAHRVLPDQLADRLVAAAIDHVIEVDRDQRRWRADIGFARERAVNREIARRYHVSPAMVLEFFDHDALPDLSDLSPICGVLASEAAARARRGASARM